MHRFINPNHHTQKSDLVARYQITPTKKDGFHNCIETLLSGLQIESHLLPSVHDINQEQYQCRIAFPFQLFEQGNIAQILSIIAYGLFNNNTCQSVKVLDLKMPENMQASFPGPMKGIAGIRELIGIKNRPLASVLLMPKNGVQTKEYLGKAYHAWMGGCDIVEESASIRSENHQDFKERINYLKNEELNCSKRSKKRKIYIPNITGASIEDTYFRAKKAKEIGVSHIMVNGFLLGQTGLISVQKICQELNLVLCSNQSGEAIWTKNTKFQISQKILAFFYRLIGIEQLHIGASVSQKTQEIVELLNQIYHKSIPVHLNTFPVCTVQNRIHIVEDLVKHYGNNIIIQAQDIIYQHPDGIKAGSEAFVCAIEAASQGIEQHAAALKNEALMRARESMNTYPSLDPKKIS